MKIRFQITGTTKLGSFVRIFLIKQTLVKEKVEFNVFEAMHDMKSVQQKMQQEAVLVQQPDVITIPYSLWQTKKYTIGDIIFIDFDCGD